MLDLEQSAVTDWLRAVHPSGPVWPPPVRPIETEGEAPALLAALGRVLSEQAAGSPDRLFNLLTAPDLRVELQRVLAQLGVARLLRILAFLPQAHIQVAALVEGASPDAQALRAAIAATGREVLLERLFGVARVGDCTTALITDIGYRLLGPDGKPDGTTVEFANGLHQISYEREPAVVPSRPGDRAIICLTVIPRACPPHDSRGRWYTVTNLRTQTTWSLPDSQHTCGGA